MLDADQKYFFFYRHQHKGDALKQALLDNGWMETRNMHRSRASFFDLDIESRIGLIDTLVRLGQKVFIYPHGARPTMAYVFKTNRPHPYVTAYITPSAGHAELIRKMDYPHPFIIPGWWLTEILPFRPYLTKKPKSVLFGPLHPNGNGWLCDLDRKINLDAYRALLRAKKTLKFKLTIRHIHSLEKNGLPPHESGVKYITGDTTGNEIDQIRDADLVVGHQTFGYKAVALGVPTVFFSEWYTPRIGNTPETLGTIDEDYWRETKHLYIFPYDLNKPGVDPVQTILDAGHPKANTAISDWRERFIGGNFNAKYFSDQIEHYCSS